MTGSEFMTGLIAHSHYRYIWVVQVILKHESVLSLVESVNVDGNWSNCLKLFHFDDTELYTVAIVELLILITAEKKILKNPNKPAPFQATTFHTSAKIFLGKVRAVFFYHHTDSVWELLSF